MTVYFIGAGPGDPDLITVKGRGLIERCQVCLFAGSLVPEAVVACAPDGARVMDTAAMTLEDTHREIVEAHGRGEDVARVHSGDPSLYGAIAEQIRRLRRENIPFEIVPGVSAYAAAAAEMGQELTIPEIAQSIVLTRMSTMFQNQRSSWSRIPLPWLFNSTSDFATFSLRTMRDASRPRSCCRTTPQQRRDRIRH